MIVANVSVGVWWAISHSDRKSDTVDAEKIARYALARSEDPAADLSSHGCSTGSSNLDPRARNLIVRLRTAAVNSVRGLGETLRLPSASVVHSCASPSGVWPCFRRGLLQALGPVLEQIAEMTKKIKHYDRMIKRLHGRRSIQRHKR